MIEESDLPEGGFIVLKTDPHEDSQRKYRKQWVKNGWTKHEFLGYESGISSYLWKVSRGDEEHV